MTDSYARDIQRQIQDDINRQGSVEDAIKRDENRLTAMESELRNISKRLEDNRKYKDLLAVHLPYRVRAHELLCKDQGWDAPEFVQPQPAQPERPRSMDSRPISDDTLDRLTGTKQLPNRSIGDQLRAEREQVIPEKPLDVNPDTVEWLEGKKE